LGASGVAGWRKVRAAVVTLGLVAAGCGGTGPVSVAPVRVSTRWEVPTPKDFTSEATTPQDPTGVLTLAEAAHNSIPEKGSSGALRRAGWRSGVSVDWATGPSTDEKAFFSDAEIAQFDSTTQAASYEAKWEASYRHAFGITPSGRVAGYDGSTFRYELVGAGTGGPFYSLFIAFRRSTYVFTWWGDGFSPPPITSSTMVRIAEEQFLRLPRQ
jgi:hypothetical protein